MTAERQIPVVHLLQGLEYGGLERVVVDLALAMHDRFQPTVLCYDTLGPLQERLTNAGIEVVCLGRRPGFDWRLIRRLHGELRRRRPAILHVHNSTAAFYGPAAAVGTGVGRIVYTEHGPPQQSTRRARAALRLVSRQISATVLVSESLRDWISGERRTPVERLHVIPNGVPTPRPIDAAAALAWRAALGLPSNAQLVASVGRLVPLKNHALLLDAFQQVLRSCPETHLLLFGDGPLREALSAQARDLGTAAAVHLFGNRDDVRTVLQLADVLAHPSDSEASSLVLIEALAAGLPVVARDVGGNSGIVEDGRSGVLAPSDVEGFAAELVSLLADESRRGRMGDAARERFRDRFDLDRVAEAYARLYASR